MPTNKKEGIQFGLIMCFSMVLVMTLYNIYLNGMMGKITITQFFIEFLIAFILALLLDLFVVGPSAQKIAFKITANTTNKVYTIVAISTCMVIGMAFFMSIFGLATYYVHNGYQTTSILVDYLSIFVMNFIVALPLQILIVGPVVRAIFTKFIQASQSGKNLFNI